MIDCLLRVMIVDDEEKERNLLKICINWNELGMEIVREASGGREALDCLEEVNPDIIITDIRMPFMDGLEFSKTVVEAYPYIKVMVLTAYEEFEYAKEGIKAGVADFLLKPIKRSEIKSALINIRNKIQAERLHKTEYEKLKKQLEDSFSYLKEKFLNELIQKSYSLDEIKNKLSYFSVDSIERYIRIALIEASHPDIDITEEQKVLLEMKCTELIKQYFKDDECIHIFVDNSGRSVILSGNKDIELVECCEQIKVMIINRLKCYVSIGIGNEYSDFKYIKKSYKEACEAINYKVLLGKNHIVSFEDTNINQDTLDIKQDDINEIGFFIKIGMSEKAIEGIQKIFHNFHVSGFKSIDHLRIITINIVTVILNSITELGLGYNDVFENSVLPYDPIMKIDNVPEMNDYITKMITHIVDRIKSIRTRKTNKIVKDIIDYLNENLSNSQLSLTLVAKAFYMNSSYLSRIFKQETGQTFVEYLTKLRIEKALDLFKGTDLMLYEVAEKIGIPDPNYFGKCFKKHVGLSVNDYKKTV
ncbi:UNVERIFIED_CONTAM: two-component system response regulator YesN [Acetivibrio alkalicellulosi]